MRLSLIDRINKDLFDKIEEAKKVDPLYQKCVENLLTAERQIVTAVITQVYDEPIPENQPRKPTEERIFSSGA